MSGRRTGYEFAGEPFVIVTAINTATNIVFILTKIIQNESLLKTCSELRKNVVITNYDWLLYLIARPFVIVSNNNFQSAINH